MPGAVVSGAKGDELIGGIESALRDFVQMMLVQEAAVRAARAVGVAVSALLAIAAGMGWTTEYQKVPGTF